VLHRPTRTSDGKSHMRFGVRCAAKVPLYHSINGPSPGMSCRGWGRGRDARPRAANGACSFTAHQPICK
jgi:hypothetical protein